MPNALVTGGARRLGRAMCLYLAGRGYDVAIHYASSSAEAEALAQEIRIMGRRAVCVQADLLDEAALAPIVSNAAEALGGPLSRVGQQRLYFRAGQHRHRHPRKLGPAHDEQPARALCANPSLCSPSAPAPTWTRKGEPVAQGLVVNMIDQKVRKLTPQHMTYSIAKMGAVGLHPNGGTMILGGASARQRHWTGAHATSP